MKLLTESSDLNNYLIELDEVDYSHFSIQKLIIELFNDKQTEIEKAKIAFEFVRDEIDHSWDIQSNRITCLASEVLQYREGICYAKSNLLAAILRAVGIPTGFCYQRLILFDTADKGYCIHALNAIYLQSINRWIRLDARGNKPGVKAEFSIHEEMLAFQVNEKFDEKDFPIIYAKPNPKTINALTENTDALKMYTHHLPDTL